MLPGPYVYGFVISRNAVMTPEGYNLSRGGMYSVYFSPVIGAVCLIIALVMRKRSYQKGIERVKGEVIKSIHNIPKEEVDQVFDAVFNEDKDGNEQIK